MKKSNWKNGRKFKWLVWRCAVALTVSMTPNSLGASQPLGTSGFPPNLRELMVLKKNEQYKLAEYIRQCEETKAEMNMVESIQSDCSHVDGTDPLVFLALSVVMFSMGYMVGGKK